MGQGFTKLTNEVQHRIGKVLPWELDMDTSPLKSAVNWPVYVPRDTRSAKSQQVRVARHRQWLVLQLQIALGRMELLLGVGEVK